ncbi:hypothetical protein [[Acholeplasma] multilocale]|uniref:hypothetical protein n=1 Tax=[Acholeplasma] multilocale TaxID=264638 RepID=UPI0003FA5D59|nr:hypothetical protein [[Acholeplasma] multilocale]
MDTDKIIEDNEQENARLFQNKMREDEFNVQIKKFRKLSIATLSLSCVFAFSTIMSFVGLESGAVVMNIFGLGFYIVVIVLNSIIIGKGVNLNNVIPGTYKASSIVEIVFGSLEILGSFIATIVLVAAYSVVESEFGHEYTSLYITMAIIFGILSSGVGIATLVIGVVKLKTYNKMIKV